jgi:hypothetical protein
LIGLCGRAGAARGRTFGFSDEGWTPEVDIGAFVSLLFEIVVGYAVTLPDDANREGLLDGIIPGIILDIIDAIGSDCKSKCSVNSIFSILKAKDFQIMTGVDLTEVLGFVRWVEECEEPTEMNHH